MWSRMKTTSKRLRERPHTNPRFKRSKKIRRPLRRAIAESPIFRRKPRAEMPADACRRRPQALTGNTRRPSSPSPGAKPFLCRDFSATFCALFFRDAGLPFPELLAHRRGASDVPIDAPALRHGTCSLFLPPGRSLHHHSAARRPSRPRYLSLAPCCPCTVRGPSQPAPVRICPLRVTQTIPIGSAMSFCFVSSTAPSGS